MIWILFLLLFIIVIMWKKNKTKTMKIEKAILESDKTGQNDTLVELCNYYGVSGKKLSDIRRKMYFRMAENDDVFALSMAALLAEDKESECKYYTRAAQLGNIEAMYMLGLRYMHRDSDNDVYSFGDDPQKSFYWFKNAADRGHQKAQEFVASALYFGDGISKDKEKSFQYAKECSDRGNAECSFFLITFFYKNIACQRCNVEKALILLKRLINKGDKEIYSRAAEELGDLYRHALVGTDEEGMPDRYRAAYYYTIAHFTGTDTTDKLTEVGYHATQYEIDRWHNDAKNLRCSM